MTGRYPAYKPTALPWLPEVPEHWEVRKVSRSFRSIGSGTTPPSGEARYFEDGLFPWINTGDLNDGILTECHRKVTQQALSDFSALKIYPANTVLIAMYGATIGKTALIKFDACVNQACCALGDSPHFLPEFVLNWFISSKEHIVSLGYGGGQPNISQETIRNLRISCPPLAEQAAIVEFIERETAALEATKARIRRELELLEEWKTALISAAVTGRLRVNSD